MSVKIAITGAGGYIGSVATYLFLQKGYEVVGIDNFSTGFQRPLEVLQEKFGKEKLRFYESDLRAVENIFKEEKNIEAVIHFAASCLVNESMKQPEKYFSNNVVASQALLEQMLRFEITKIVFSSTCAVYGDARYVPIDEKHPTNPENPYGESKRMMERMIEWYGTLKGFRYIILRYFNVAGATDDGMIGDAKKPSPHLMQNAVRGALDIEPFYLTYSEVDTPDKSPIRDYVNVVDLNEAHIAAVEHVLSGRSSDVINLGTEKGNSVLEIIDKVQEITGANIETHPSPTPRQGESPKLIASIEKAKQVLGWSPKRSIEDSVRSMVTWYKAHPHGWEY